MLYSSGASFLVIKKIDSSTRNHLAAHVARSRRLINYTWARAYAPFFKHAWRPNSMANLGESRVDEKVERRVPKPLQLTAHCVFQVAILNGKIPYCHPRVHPNPPQISRHSTTQKLGRISFCTTLGCIPRCIPRESELQDSKCTFHVFAHTHTHTSLWGKLFFSFFTSRPFRSSGEFIFLLLKLHERYRVAVLNFPAIFPPAKPSWKAVNYTLVKLRLGTLTSRKKRKKSR